MNNNVTKRMRQKLSAECVLGSIVFMCDAHDADENEFMTLFSQMKKTK